MGGKKFVLLITLVATRRHRESLVGDLARDPLLLEVCSAKTGLARAAKLTLL